MPGPQATRGATSPAPADEAEDAENERRRKPLDCCLGRPLAAVVDRRAPSCLNFTPSRTSISPASRRRPRSSRGARSTSASAASGEWKLVDDRDLVRVHPPRRDSIGVRSAPYGAARVNVFDAAATLVATATTETTNWCHITGLQPDTVYTYEVIVNDEIWAEGERYDWQPGADQGLVKSGGSYVNAFRTHPAPDQSLSRPADVCDHRRLRRRHSQEPVRPSGSARSARR